MSTLSENNRRWGIVACIAAMTTVSIALGLTWPLLALKLEHMGVPTWLNGMSAASQTIAVLAVAPLGPRLIGWLGITRIMFWGVVLLIVSLLMLPIFPNVWIWFPIRFFIGFAAEMMFTGGDIWINQLARDHSRGRLIGLYGMFLHGGFALGPVAIVILGSDSWSSLYIGVAVIALALLPLYWARHGAPAIEGRPRARMLYFLRIAPTLMIAGLMFGLIDSSTLTLLPVYAIDNGLSAEAGAFLLTVFVLGSVVTQVPVGWLCDHYDRRVIMAVFVAVGAISIFMIPLVISHTWATWTVMASMGMALGSFYVIAMSMIGARFRGADLIGINASFVFLWGGGAVIGPPVSGAAMEWMGPVGMPITGGTFCLLFLVLILLRIRRAKQSDVRSQT